MLIVFALFTFLLCLIFLFQLKRDKESSGKYPKEGIVETIFLGLLCFLALMAGAFFSAVSYHTVITEEYNVSYISSSTGSHIVTIVTNACIINCDVKDLVIIENSRDDSMRLVITRDFVGNDEYLSQEDYELLLGYGGNSVSYTLYVSPEVKEQFTSGYPIIGYPLVFAYLFIILFNIVKVQVIC